MKTIIFFLISLSAFANSTKYPISAALNHVGWDIGSQSRTIEIVTASAETFNEATITVVDKGYLDDSLFGKKWIIKVSKNEKGRWERKKVETLNICSRMEKGVWETKDPCP